MRHSSKIYLLRTPNLSNSSPSQLPSDARISSDVTSVGSMTDVLEASSTLYALPIQTSAEMPLFALALSCLFLFVLVWTHTNSSQQFQLTNAGFLSMNYAIELAAFFANFTHDLAGDETCCVHSFYQKVLRWFQALRSTVQAISNSVELKHWEQAMDWSWNVILTSRTIPLCSGNLNRTSYGLLSSIGPDQPDRLAVNTGECPNFYVKQILHFP